MIVGVHGFILRKVRPAGCRITPHSYEYREKPAYGEARPQQKRARCGLHFIYRSDENLYALFIMIIKRSVEDDQEVRIIIMPAIVNAVPR